MSYVKKSYFLRPSFCTHTRMPLNPVYMYVYQDAKKYFHRYIDQQFQTEKDSFSAVSSLHTDMTHGVLRYQKIILNRERLLKCCEFYSFSQFLYGFLFVDHIILIAHEFGFSNEFPVCMYVCMCVCIYICSCIVSSSSIISYS